MMKRAEQMDGQDKKVMNSKTVVVQCMKGGTKSFITV